ncbi:rod shape-determining protein MreD [Antarcticimicrobium sediminis]|uniref:Rod shape-determining protein MreD n=1 Tax=Antarcticimicrobium sediminis TaxID=2546227 RepID=A0A4R5EX12_9RHOB|nr:rod shape-determining protein MreD [Antarcticimicrobium sediminis]TDE39579.1 rod shape-determining protein MreD [Antarcticimicrobium sediminis]
MASPSPSHLWLMRAAFLGLALLIMFFHLIPLDTVPRRWAPPDLLIAAAFAWCLRRPDFAPAASIAAMMLMADLLFQRPPGLMALLVVLGSEYLKTRAGGLREASFAGEWLAVCLTLLAITVLNRLVLALLAVEQAQLSLSLFQMVMTMLAYPLVVLVTQSLMGVRKLSPSDVEAMGNRA